MAVLPGAVTSLGGWHIHRDDDDDDTRRETAGLLDLRQRAIPGHHQRRPVAFVTAGAASVVARRSMSPPSWRSVGVLGSRLLELRRNNKFVAIFATRVTLQKIRRCMRSSCNFCNKGLVVEN